MGPVTTDSRRYDHITSAIGRAISAGTAPRACYVTRRRTSAAEPGKTLTAGVIAIRVAPTQPILDKGTSRAREWDDALSKARFDFRGEDQSNSALDSVPRAPTTTRRCADGARCALLLDVRAKFCS